jgi:hypothetical protein
MVFYVGMEFILMFANFAKEKYNPQSIGLLITYSIKIFFYILDSFKRFRFLTVLLISLERCDSYTKIAQEKFLKTEFDSTLDLV